MSDEDERQLVEAAQRDPSRFGALYERHVDDVHAYIARRVRSREAAEDLTAEVFHKALASLPQYRWRGAPFGAWLFRIAANALVDRARHDAREVVDSDRLPEVNATPDMDLFDQHARLHRLVARLPADQRTVIQERFVEQRSIKEI